ncbi:MAG: PAS domain S-box protein [Chitinophaga sp.]|uniref:PAS domain S-box protein n=1 Tax=Chitinophaga sp. TaxID=1869181 RepID=UPI0025BD6AE9|nr:PAS domain S-box protein [Chitinophaga sp.]MBV8253611.1 PAS domain S-box protein [Chitinophaga sp.]
MKNNKHAVLNTILIVLLLSIVGLCLYQTMLTLELAWIAALLVSLTTVLMYVLYRRAGARAEKIIADYKARIGDDDDEDAPPEVGVFFVDKDLNFSYMNREMRRICGYKYKEIVGKPWTFMCSDFLAEWLHTVVTTWLDDVMPIVRPFIDIKTKDGKTVRLLAFISLMEQPNNNTLFQAIVNIVPLKED